MALSDPNDFTVRPDVHRRAKEKRIELRIGRAIIAASLIALFLFSAVVIYSLINQGTGEPIVVEAEPDIRVSADDINREAVEAPPGSDVYVLTQQQEEEGGALLDILGEEDAPADPGTSSEASDSVETQPHLDPPKVDSTPLPRQGEIGSPIPSGWYVQLSSFSSKDKALSAVDMYTGKPQATALKDNPLRVYTLVLNNGKTVHRVIAGPGSNSTLMRDLCSDIKKSGLSDCLVIRVRN